MLQRLEKGAKRKNPKPARVAKHPDTKMSVSHERCAESQTSNTTKHVKSNAFSRIYTRGVARDRVAEAVRTIGVHRDHVWET